MIVPCGHFINGTLMDVTRAQSKYRKTLMTNGVGIRTPTDNWNTVPLYSIGVSSACLVDEHKHGSSHFFFSSGVFCFAFR